MIVWTERDHIAGMIVAILGQGHDVVRIQVRFAVVLNETGHPAILAEAVRA